MKDPKNNRYINNLALLSLLEQAVSTHHDMRFSQILANFGYVISSVPNNLTSDRTWKNEFYLESSDLLGRVAKANENINKALEETNEESEED